MPRTRPISLAAAVALTAGPIALNSHTAAAQQRPDADANCAVPAHFSPEAPEAPEAPGTPGAPPEPGPELAQLHRFATGKGVRVAVIDTGVAPHPELPHLLPGVDLVEPDAPNPFRDCDSHGTVVAGIIAAHSRGLAPDAEVVAIRQTSAHTRQSRTAAEGSAGSLQTLASAIHYALDQEARVLNISVVSCLAPEIAARVDMQPINAALARAEEQGAVVVAAAGNASEHCEPGYTVIPAHARTVISVGARDSAYTLASYSMPGPQPDLSAPGEVEVALASDGAGWARGTVARKGAVQPYVGTSFAAPVVAGTVALLLERYPHLRPHEVRALLQAASQHRGGALDSLAVLGQLPPSAPEPHPVRVTPAAHEGSAAPTRWSRLALAVTALVLVAGAFAYRRPPHPQHTTYSTAT